METVESMIRPPLRSADKVAVFFDEQAFLMQQTGGISRYVCALAKELAATGQITAHIFGGINSNTHFHDLQPEPGLSRQFIRRRDRLRINTLISHLSQFWRRRAFQKIRRRFNHVIYHPSFYEVDPVIAARADATAVTFHDMIPEWLASGNPRTDPISLPFVKRSSARAANLVLANSQATRADVLSAYPDLKLNIVVTPLAPMLPAPDPKLALPPGLAAQKYFLMVGNRGGYKNGEMVFKAFVRVAKAHPQVALVGFGGESLMPVEAGILEQEALLPRFHHLRGGDELLSTCYRHAAGLVYPSRHEGFGLPVLEAMQSGCPVITTPCTSLPEIGGQAALYVNPDDEQGFCRAMCSLLENSELRSRLVESGLQRSKLFLWRKTALATLAAYQQVLENNSAPQKNKRQPSAPSANPNVEIF